MTDREFIHITPDLPRGALMEIKEWRSGSKYNNSFYRVLEQTPVAVCKNCGDSGFIMVSFTRAGPFDTLPNHKAGETITWFNGNEQSGRGWYIVVRTISYDCQHCDRLRAKKDESHVSVNPKAVQKKLVDLAEHKSG